MKYEQVVEDKLDVMKDWEELLDNDEISSREEGFFRGWDDSL